MLTSSFVLLDGVGPARETSLWRNGVRTWNDFIAEPRIKGISDHRKEAMDTDLEEAKERLKQGDSGYFASRLAQREQWRCLREFSRSTAYVDIETTGISRSSPITVVGIYDGSRMHTLVRGQNLNGESLGAVLSSVNMLVTFNGAGFDLPVMERAFPGSVPRIPHVDLRHALRRIGLTGGLKMVEREVGIERDRRLEYMTGQDAVYLWKLWEKDGKRNALDLLLEYNAADCMNLKTLAEHAYRVLKSGSFDRAAACH